MATLYFLMLVFNPPPPLSSPIPIHLSTSLQSQCQYDTSYCQIDVYTLYFIRASAHALASNTETHAFPFLPFENSSTVLHMFIFISFLLLLLGFYDHSMGCHRMLTALWERVRKKNQPNSTRRLCHCAYGLGLNGIKFKINIHRRRTDRPSTLRFCIQ